MEIVKSKSLKKPIVSIKILDDDSLVVVDSETTVRYLDRNSFDMLNGFKVEITHKRYKTQVFDFSKNGECFATLTSDCRESRLYSAKTNKIITKVDRHHGEASCVGIDPLSRYMFSCGDDGKTFAMDVKSGSLVFTLPVHVDTVNDIAFSENGNWAATASYDRKISLFNLVTMTPRTKLKAHTAPVMHVRFFHKNKLLSIDKNSTAIVWNIADGKVIERLQGIHDDVINITMSADEKFLFLGTALGYVLLYDLHTYELLSGRYIKITSPIIAMEFDATRNHLILGTEDGFLISYDIYEGEETLKELLTKKEFESIQGAADSNPILAYTKIYELISNLWENTLEKAKIALQNGDKKRAVLLFKHFKNIPSKNRIMQQVIRDYADFGKFRMYAEQGKLALAYSLANKYPIYKDSKLYKALEVKWKKSFAEAQKYALQPKGTDKAKDILAPYRGISEKTKLIQELLTQGEVYRRFRVSIGQKDFKICFELIKQHPFLQEFPEYETLMNYADGLYIKSQELIKKGDTHGALRILHVLVDFPDFSEEVKVFMKEIDSRQNFFKAIEERDIVTAYNMMSETEDLQDTEDGMRLQEMWNKDLAIANKFAVEGDSPGVEKSLTKYMKTSSKYMAIGTIFGWCYMVQLENAVVNKRAQHEIENGIKNYMLNFGLQDQIENFFLYFKDSYPNSKLTLEHLTHGSLSMWRPSMIVDSILD
jgi:WD domain, G-beta repeat